MNTDINTPVEDFVLLIKTIVNKEMDEFQQGEYEIEGRELVYSSFQQQLPVYEERTGNKMAVGLSPEALDAIKEITAFGALIVSCANLYLELRQAKNKSLEFEMEKTEALGKLKSYMEKEKMPPELIDKINQKYAQQIIDTVNKIP